MKQTLLAMFVVLALAGLLFSSADDPRQGEAKYYDNAKVVRVKFVEGEGFIQRSYDEGNEEAVANLPLFENDSAGTTNGRIELYLGRLNYLRLDNDTLVKLTKAPQLGKTDLSLRLEKGGVYLDIGNLDYEKSVEAQTPDCGIFLLERGRFRINVLDDGRTEVYVFEGTAEVSGHESSRTVRENQKIVMENGEISERPYYFTASDRDDFDRWNDERNKLYSNSYYGSSRYLQNGYEDYENELTHAGRWAWMNDYNCNVWMPYSIGTGWRPYFNGRWVWNPYYGYTWCSYDSCGWFTHHYGRWGWDYDYGWYWVPGYHWSPAWVSWFWDDFYYGWCPLSWWNRPIFVMNNYWYRDYDFRHGFPHGSRSTIVIRKGELAAPHIDRVAVAAKDQLSSHNLAFHSSAPGERPMLNKLNVIDARGRTAVYKENGLVSESKYQALRAENRDTHAAKTAVFKYAGPQTPVTERPKYSGSESNRRREGENQIFTSRSHTNEGNRGNTEYNGGIVRRRSDSGRSSSGQSQNRVSSSSRTSQGTVRKRKKDTEPYSYQSFSSRTEPTQSQDRNSSTASRTVAPRYTPQETERTPYRSLYTSPRYPSRNESYSNSDRTSSSRYGTPYAPRPSVSPYRPSDFSSRGSTPVFHSAPRSSAPSTHSFRSPSTGSSSTSSGHVRKKG